MHGEVVAVAEAGVLELNGDGLTETTEVVTVDSVSGHTVVATVITEVTTVVSVWLSG